MSIDMPTERTQDASLVSYWRARALRAEYKLSYRAQLDRVDQGIMKPNVKTSLYHVREAYTAGEPNEQGWVQIEPWQVASYAGEKKETLLAHITACKKLGVIEKHIERIYNDRGQVERTDYFIRPTEITDQPPLYASDDPHPVGGWHCKSCGGTRRRRTITDECMDCGETHVHVIEPPEPDKPQGLIASLDEEANHDCENTGNIPSPIHGESAMMDDIEPQGLIASLDRPLLEALLLDGRTIFSTDLEVEGCE